MSIYSTGARNTTTASCCAPTLITMEYLLPSTTTCGFSTNFPCCTRRMACLERPDCCEPPLHTRRQNYDMVHRRTHKAHHSPPLSLRAKRPSSSPQVEAQSAGYGLPWSVPGPEQPAAVVPGHWGTRRARLAAQLGREVQALRIPTAATTTWLGEDQARRQRSRRTCPRQNCRGKRGLYSRRTAARKARHPMPAHLPAYERHHRRCAHNSTKSAPSCYFECSTRVQRRFAHQRQHHPHRHRHRHPRRPHKQHSYWSHTPGRGCSHPAVAVVSATWQRLPVALPRGRRLLRGHRRCGRVTAQAAASGGFQ